MRIGILGGGQLARMLAEAALKLSLDVVVFAGSEHVPAAGPGARLITGSFKDYGALAAFFARADIVLFENEFVDCALLGEAARGLPVRFAPSLEVIRKLQDKLVQKQVLGKLQIPTSPFVQVSLDTRSGGRALKRAVLEATSSFPDGWVLKWSRMGYDGKGIFIAADQDPATLKRAVEFCRKAVGGGIAVYAEKKVDFVRELALVAARSAAGGFMAYPLVVSQQEMGVCRLVMGPASALGVSPGLEQSAINYARLLAEQLDLIGIFALELFETKDGRLLINEIAPRVHNSGHCTMDACSVSQFETHLRAILGQSLIQPKCKPIFAMVNLLGPEGIKGKVTRGDLPRASESVRVHWYDKIETRPRRKLGHVNAVADSLDQRHKVLDCLQKYQDAWIASLRKKAKRK